MSHRLADLTIAILVVTALGIGCGGDDPSSPPPPPPTPTQIGFTVQPSQTLRDSVIAPAVQVEVRGASGARIAGATNTVTLALEAHLVGAALYGTTSVAAVDGIATFANLRVTERSRGYRLVASSPSLTPDTSGVFDIVIPLHPDVVVPGVEHTCAVAGYSVACWGRNDSGELGDNTLVSKPLAARVPFESPGASFVGVAVGGSHTCATTSVAKLYCWGSNASGQLGIGSQDERRTLPALVSGVAVAWVSAGSAHTCAVTTPQPDSTYVYCWGANDNGHNVDWIGLSRLEPSDDPDSSPDIQRLYFDTVERSVDHSAVNGRPVTIQWRFTDAAPWYLRIDNGASRAEPGEGLEALLIIVAMLTFLRKAERPEMIRPVHYGWVAALIAGLGTWWAATHLLTISGASRITTLMRVTFPLLLPPFIGGWVWVFAHTIRSFSIPLMLATPGNDTIAVVMYHYWERKADFSLASTLGVAMLVSVGILTMLSRKFIAQGFTKDQ